MATKTKIAKRPDPHRRTDAETEQLYAALAVAFPGLPAESSEVVYKSNPVSIRLCVVDERFGNKSTEQRWGQVKRAIKGVPEEIRENITMAMMLTPEEKDDPAMMADQFFHPDGSRL